MLTDRVEAAAGVSDVGAGEQRFGGELIGKDVVFAAVPTEVNADCRGRARGRAIVRRFVWKTRWRRRVQIEHIWIAPAAGARIVGGRLEDVVVSIGRIEGRFFVERR